MNFLDKIKETFRAGKLKKVEKEQLHQLITGALSDGVLTGKEVDDINQFYSRSQLSAEDFQKLKSDIFVQAVQKIILDRRVDEHEQGLISAIAQQLEILPEWVEWAKQQTQYYSAFHYIEAGGELPVVNPKNLVLQKGEVCHLSLAAALLEERVIRRETVGRSHGLSIPIVKGVRYTVGRSRGRVESQIGIVPVSTGYFSVTNKKLVFSGSKSVATPLTKLIDIQLFSDGLQFSSTSRQKPTLLKFSRDEEAELAGLVISRLVNL